MYLTDIEKLLSKKIGVDCNIIGSRKIAKAVESRCSVCNLSDLKIYLQLLQTSPEEFTELVELIVVPETYFFRDRKSFDYLINFVRSQWLTKSNQSLLRILSVPCSTGEEPYSIAIALMETGLSTSQFCIDAIDISKQAIAKAQQGVYSKNSFRGEVLVDRNRYFQQTAEKYEISLSVRNAVNFKQGNLINSFFNVQLKYDVIFCRNLLIYLEDSACTEVLKTLNRLLLPNGLLFVGAAETAKVPSNLFASIRQPFTVYKKKAEGMNSKNLYHLPIENYQAENIELGNQQNNQARKVQPESFFIPSISYSENLLENTSFLATIPSDSVSEASLKETQSIQENSLSLELAKQLADGGHLEAAIKHCNEYLECVSSTNAQAYTLLGTLYQAKTNYVQAEEFFRKALYLNPSDYEALTHLALLKEHRGDFVGASILRERIQKLQ
ncbi:MULTISPECIES: CheR family methyltransferase [unclassified Nostoc]|uniref:CheR family methyltransferase n=1 Tax=unclassified Nostoc TaxID=2593658 RepID=UPI002AD3ADF6|nr:CheR family methyltransferase [Nostoc sp. DedQUE03]MDZ7974989.1 CheR family methyltransferase [Nostoc sp. DedQUE03]MDZ8046624.1 CheR family methyltransferase [Nostoc sp. DedQUE02]